MLQSIKFSIVLWASFVLVGCSHHYETQPRPISERDLVDIKTSSPVQILAVNPKADKVVVFKQMGHKCYASLHNMTESAVFTTKQCLRNMGVEISDDAEKTLSVSITQAKGKIGFATFKVHVTLQAKTVDGLVKEYTESQTFGSHLMAATPYLEMCISRCVADMLVDHEIVQYLQQ